MLEGVGAKEKQKARKERPEGWSECATLTRIRGDYRKRCVCVFFSPGEEGRIARALRPEPA